MTGLEWTILSSSLAGAAFVLALYVGLRTLNVQSRYQRRLDDYEHALNTATSGAIGMGQRILLLEKQLRTLSAAQAATPESDSALYTQAMQLFDSGADENTVVANCGISSSEARLMALIRQKTGARGSAALDTAV